MITFTKTLEIEINYDELLCDTCEYLEGWYDETEYENIDKQDVADAMVAALDEETDYCGLENYDNFEDNLVVIAHNLKLHIVENNIVGDLEQIIERLL